MIELRIHCPACRKQGDHGTIVLDLVSGEMNVECGWCHAEWKLNTEVLEAPMPESRKDYMPKWKQDLLGV